MLLADKHVLVFAASGAVAGRVARTCADHGATVWLSARRGDAAEKLAAAITEAGGRAHAAEVDATDPAAVDDHVAATAAAAGRIDAVFNGIGGRPADLAYPRTLADLDLDGFLTPLRRIVGAQYLTSRAAGLVMARQGHGAVVTLSATLSGMAAPYMANIAATCGAVEAMTRSLAGELGPSGVRVNCVRANAMPETRTIAETGAGQAAITGAPPAFGVPPLGRPVTLAETAATVAFLASDLASGTSGQVVTVCGGQFV
jgi:NAD(P)-dependent dehydrogenase (short-subunit alcohol dehydrogenase family)